jgi:hypothetical protein
MNMGNLRLAVIFTLFLFPSVLAGRQSAPAAADFHDQIQKLYNFHPHALTAPQRAEKSDSMDRFWEKAKAQPALYVPGLRRELVDFTNPSFFFFDGSQLLLSLSDDPADQTIVSAALVHADLQDTASSAYFYLVHALAAEGNDTTLAAFNILSDPKFQVIVPEHAITLAQNYCLVFMLLPTEQTFWLQPAIDRLHKETDSTAQKSLLLLVWYAQTAASDKAILDFAGDSTKPQIATAHAKELMNQKAYADPRPQPNAPPAGEESLRPARAARMKAVSDESVDDLDLYTSEIMNKRH